MKNSNKIRLTLIALIAIMLWGCNAITPSHHSDAEPPIAITDDETALDTTQAAEDEENIDSVHYLEASPVMGLITLPEDHQNEENILFPQSDAETVSGTVQSTAPPAEIDIWDRLRAGYGLKDHDHPGVQVDQTWYARHPSYLLRTIERAQPYLFYIIEQVEARGMPTEIALLPIVESAFQPFAYSHSRAAGIWQFIPSTGKLHGLKQNWWYDGRRDVYAATQAALDYLQKHHQRFDGDWLLALAAYNAGAGTVSRAIKRNKKAGKPTDFWNLKLPKETRGYVPKLLALSNIIAEPEKYQATLAAIPNQPHFVVVDTESQIDLALAAELADMTTEELYYLNPGFNRWATDPEGPHRLLIPIEKAPRFTQALEVLESDKRVKWVRHKIRRGETLSHIAKNHHTSVELIKQTNNLRGNSIRTGHYLLIPTAQRALNSYTLTADRRQQSIQSRKRDGHKITHTVQQGDTLWDISRKHKVGVQELAKWNAMAPRDTLKPGQKLVVWSGKTTAAPQSLQSTLGDAALQKVNYRVRNGDSLARIAQRFKVSVGDLVRWNGLDSKKYLQPGQALTLYVDVTRQSG